jgi:DnaJ-class molecular chaperone
MSKTKSNYEILGVPDFSTIQEVKKSFRKKVRELRPDINDSCDKSLWNEIQEAYEILSDMEQKQEYDKKLKLDKNQGDSGIITAKKLFKEGKYEEAREICNKILNSNQNNTEASKLLGDIFRAEFDNL